MADPGGDRDTDGTDDWKFSVEEFTDEADGEAVGLDAAAGETKEDRGNITGSLTSDRPLEPGDIDPENAFFVLVGFALVGGLVLGTIVGF
jgi:hypothetical protein